MTHCRSCGSDNLLAILSLGRMALANALLDDDTLTEPEAVFPLDLVFCGHCSLVQITETVPPEQLFREYLYFSSYSDTLLDHVQSLATEIIRGRDLGADSLVIEIASNDGYLLQYYKAAGVPVLGIEPAVNIARVAEQDRGIPTIPEFFTPELAQRLRSQARSADVIHAHNVLAHVADLNGFVAGIASLLKDKGVAVFEVPYVRDMVEKCEFDTIYHEHLCYFSLTALCALFARHDLEIQDVDRVAIHGGSLRVFAGRTGSRHPLAGVANMLRAEGDAGIDRPATYENFGSAVKALKTELNAVVRELKRAGNTLAVYGASAKAAVLLNYCGLGGDIFDYVVDKSPHKVGRYLPGVHLPIFHPDKLIETMPDYTLLTVWNIAEEILKQQAAYCSNGGRFIQPVPKVVIL